MIHLLLLFRIHHPQQSKLEATAPFASTTIRPLSPPKAQRPASPGAIDFRALILQEQRAGRKVEVASKLQLEVQSRLLVLLKAASYYKLLAGRVREYRLLKLKLVRASYKIQCTFRAMRSRSSLKMYLLVPPLFTRFLHRYKRRRAVAVVQSFIRDVQSCRTKRIVRRFLMAVKKVQSEFRNSNFSLPPSLSPHYLSPPQPMCGSTCRCVRPASWR